jgi:SAM-dependent methyltransferase
MHLDVVDLRNFYYRTSLGRVAQRAIRDQMLAFWPEAKSQTVAGFGFAVPLLRPYLADARRVIALMPAPQGVMPWPAGRDNVSVLCEDTRWPLPTGLVDRLVLLHGLETSEQPSAVLEESCRVLGPGGRVLLVVPYRGGMWARNDRTPFGFGRPYSLGQVEAQLRRHSLQVEGHHAALFVPPSGRQFWLKTAQFWEDLGRRVSKTFAGGVLMVEATRHVQSPRRSGLREAVRRPLEVLDGLPVPAPKPA